MNPIIQATNLGKRISLPTGELTILSQINLEIENGESVAITGASGSGKSTLLGLLAGLDTATCGIVEIGGVDLARLDEDGRAALRANLIGFVFQSFQLLPSLTALENVMLPLELTAGESPRENAIELLGKVGLEQRLGHYPIQLSGGEQQRVAIARAFVTKPRILFADEPTGNLDTETGKTIGKLLFNLNKDQSTTLILVTHDSELAKSCSCVIELDQGRLKNRSDDLV